MGAQRAQGNQMQSNYEKNQTTLRISGTLIEIGELTKSTPRDCFAVIEREKLPALHLTLSQVEAAQLAPHMFEKIDIIIRANAP
jgi:hypothetical protein